MCPCLPAPVFWEGSNRVSFISEPSAQDKPWADALGAPGVKEEGAEQAVDHRPSGDMLAQWALR